jgi:hypothetical protein
MTRYFFHIWDGAEFIEDPEGVELPGVSEARAEAVEAAREMIAEKIRRGQVPDGQAFHITRDDGEVVAKVKFRDAARLD